MGFNNKKYCFNNQIVVITGAGTGIGRETALAFAEKGATIVLVAKMISDLEQVIKEIKKIKTSFLPLEADVSQLAQVERVIKKIVEKYNRIDILVNNASIVQKESIVTTKIEDIRYLMDVNYYGVINFTKSVLPFMIRQRSGHIVNVSSIFGKKACALLSSYCASKFAISAFSEALRQEFKESNINVTVVYPGFTDTPMLRQFSNNELIQKINLLKPRTVAETIVKAVIKKQREVILPFNQRILITIDKFSPKLGDWLLRKYVYNR